MKTSENDWFNYPAKEIGDMALELSSNLEIQELVMKAKSRIEALNEIRKYLYNHHEYKERIDNLPLPIRTEEPFFKGSRSGNPLGIQSPNEFMVARDIIEVIRPDWIKEDR